MKKYILIVAVFLSGICTYAQNSSRWYDHYEIIRQLYGNYYPAEVLMGFDDSYEFGDTAGVTGPPPYFSVGQIVDPIKYETYNDPLFVDANSIQVTYGDPYKIDSVRILANYSSYSDTLTDTLIFSVAVCNQSHEIDETEYPWILNCVAGDTSLLLFTPERPYVDSINRAAYSDDPAAPRVLWKVPISGSVQNTLFSFPVMIDGVPGSYSVPAGDRIVVTCTFKGDSRMIHDLFIPVAGNYYSYEADTYPLDSDDNMSLLMYSNDSSNYYPTLYTTGVYHTNYSLLMCQYIDIAAHVTCEGCKTVGEVTAVKNINGNIPAVTATPNPAGNKLTIKYSLPEQADVRIMLTDMLGRIVYEKSMGYAASGQCTLPVSALPEGVYMYKVVANGQPASGKILIAH